MSERRLRDVDSAGRAQKIHAAVWALLGGTGFALLGGWKFGLTGFVLGWVIGFAVIFFLTILVADAFGRIGSRVYLPGAGSPPHREYSLGDALAAQGRFDDAVREYESNAARYPEDPEPQLRLARLYRDRMAKPEQAADWFKHVLAVPTLDAGIERLAAAELVELFTHKLKQPQRALPILARLAEQRPSSATGVWARAELIEVKRQMRGNL
jgi:hypothetical protein